MVYNCRVFAWAVIMQVYFVMYCEINCLSSATHGHNIHSLVCVCVCLSVCLSSTFSVNSPTGQTPQRIFTVDSLKDADVRRDVPFGV